MAEFFILDAQRCPMRCADEPAWLRWRETAALDVARTGFVDGSELCTSFVGLDQRKVADDGPPLLFESTILLHAQGDEWEVATAGLYASWAEAEAGHQALVGKINDNPLMASIRRQVQD